VDAEEPPRLDAQAYLPTLPIGLETQGQAVRVLTPTQKRIGGSGDLIGRQPLQVPLSTAVLVGLDDTPSGSRLLDGAVAVPVSRTQEDPSLIDAVFATYLDDDLLSDV
jgi:hypothetical protein